MQKAAVATRCTRVNVGLQMTKRPFHLLQNFKFLQSLTITNTFEDYLNFTYFYGSFHAEKVKCRSRGVGV